MAYLVDDLFYWFGLLTCLLYFNLIAFSVGLICFLSPCFALIYNTNLLLVSFRSDVSAWFVVTYLLVCSALLCGVVTLLGLLDSLTLR